MLNLKQGPFTSTIDIQLFGVLLQGEWTKTPFFGGLPQHFMPFTVKEGTPDYLEVVHGNVKGSGSAGCCGVICWDRVLYS